MAVCLSLVISALTVCAQVRAQQSVSVASEERDRGIQLYRQGETAAAIKILNKVVQKHSDDADAWYYLGLALASEGSFLFARPAFEHLLKLRPDSADANAKLAYALILGNEPEQAITTAQRALELGDQSAESHYAIAEASFRTGMPTKAIEEAEMALKIRPDFAPALITKSLAHYSLKQYSEAAASLEKFLAINPNDPDGDVWREQLERLHNLGQSLPRSTSLANSAQPGQDLPVNGKEVTIRARVLSKPEPTYTEAARKAGVTGTVILRCVFSSDGKVRNLVVLRALGYGLTSKAVQAARRIKFTPAVKDGRQVSMWTELQYNFNLY